MSYLFLPPKQFHSLLHKQQPHSSSCPSEELVPPHFLSNLLLKRRQLASKENTHQREHRDTAARTTRRHIQTCFHLQTTSNAPLKSFINPYLKAPPSQIWGKPNRICNLRDPAHERRNPEITVTATAPHRCYLRRYHPAAPDQSCNGASCGLRQAGTPKQGLRVVLSRRVTWKGWTDHGRITPPANSKAAATQSYPNPAVLSIPAAGHAAPSTWTLPPRLLKQHLGHGLSSGRQ